MYHFKVTSYKIWPVYLILQLYNVMYKMINQMSNMKNQYGEFRNRVKYVDGWSLSFLLRCTTLIYGKDVLPCKANSNTVTVCTTSKQKPDRHVNASVQRQTQV